MGTLTRKQVAELLKIGLSTLDTLPIPKIRISQRCVRYLEKDVREYMEKVREE